MKKLSFPAELYTEQPDTNSWKFFGDEGRTVGVLELVWIAIQRSILNDLKEKDHLVNRRLKWKVRAVTRYRDKDKDSRISLEGEQILLLEEDEMNLLSRHAREGNTYPSVVSDDAGAMFDVLLSAEEYDPKESLKLLESK